MATYNPRKVIMVGLGYLKVNIALNVKKKQKSKNKTLPVIHKDELSYVVSSDIWAVKRKIV